MLIFKRIKDIQNHLKKIKKQGKTVGFVPTMGALHLGHLSLLETSKQNSNVCVCSIFVNPTQFNDKSDFTKYPNTRTIDIEKLSDAGCHILFLPSVTEIYPHGFENKTPIDFGFITETLEGKHRPGHFDGVAQVVEKLLRIINPGKLYMGQKDYQQQLIVRKLINKRRFKAKLILGKTIREKDGLAMSSRNVRLNKESRKIAVEISRTLKKVKSEVRSQKSEIRSLQKYGIKRLSYIQGIEPEYFEIRNADTLKPAKNKSEKLIALAAVKIGGVRLIDNMVLN